ncbi:MAG: cell division protein FtsQ/DivIB, partial [Caldanaerobacter sp.]
MNKRTFKLLFLLLMLLIFSYGLVFHTDYFKIKSIKVVGNQILSYNDVKDMSGLRTGINIFKVNTKQVEDALLKNPYVRNCRVKVKYPNGVEIFIEERQPMAQIKYKEEYLKIDREGVVLEKGRFSPDLLIIEGLKVEKFEVGRKLGDNFNDTLVCKLLGVIDDKKNFHTIRYISQNEVEITTKQGINILLKNPLDVNYSFKFAELILKDLVQRGYRNGKIEIIGDGSA